MINREWLLVFFKQAVRYGIVGFSGITTNLLIFSFLVYVIGVWYIFAGLFAGWVSMTQNFILHRKFSFVDQAKFNLKSRESLKRYFRFFLLSVFNAPAFSSLLFFLVEFVKLEKIVAQFITSVSLGLISFIISRKFIFY